MKNILLFVYIVFISIHVQAQNSTLWYKIQEIRQQYFPETANEVLHSTIGGFGTDPYKSYTGKYYKSPVVYIDNKVISYPGQATSEQDAKAKINSYQLTDIAGIDYHVKSSVSAGTFGMDGTNGVILVYTQEYTAANPWVREFFKISFENGQTGDRKKKNGK
ncbi:hypothetical protein [Raineya orbicola]|uniref:Uncharacterized protein n=1 Tax=Raineya orbicola TaxID=2016530 RepID=A0A2N3ICJ1_9BACT|nr:hypothetical protein [Raineya orbicola]PKQ67999.1 hypothetical protein Rain11_1810 [Raineya orbicola]